MARAKKSADKPGKPTDTAANLGFEAKLWAAAALRNNMDAAEYEHVILGLIVPKYVSDAFAAKHAELEADKISGADPEDPDEYRAAHGNTFHNDKHPDLKTDYVLSNPPVNDSDWRPISVFGEAY